MEQMVPGGWKYFDYTKLAWLKCCGIIHFGQGPKEKFCDLGRSGRDLSLIVTFALYAEKYLAPIRQKQGRKTLQELGLMKEKKQQLFAIPALKRARAKEEALRSSCEPGRTDSKIPKRRNYLNTAVTVM
jgi:hypothetical protein